VAEGFTCAVEDEDYLSACKDLPKYSGSRYCVLHEPDEAKNKEEFEEVKKSKLARKDYDFGGAVFPEGTSDFEGREFDADTSFDGATFIGEANFKGAQFSGERTNFPYAQFSGEATDFSYAQFSGEATDFSYAQFSGERTEFLRAKFNAGWTSFTEAQFSGGWTLFSWAQFSGGQTSFTLAQFSGEGINFTGAQFSGTETTSFSHAQFSGEWASFEGAQFSSRWIDFTEAQFSGERTNFTGAQFSGEQTFFPRTQFSGEGTSFSDATFNAGWTNFEGAQFSGEWTDFSNTQFSGEQTFFPRTQFSSKQTSFSDATFNAGWTNFTEAQFCGTETNFAGARFSAYTSFVSATFTTKTVRFSKATFRAKAEFWGSGNNSVFDSQAWVWFDSYIEKPELLTFNTVLLHPGWFINTDVRKVNFTDVKWYGMPGGPEGTLDEEIAALAKSDVESPHSLLAQACRRLSANAEENREYPLANEFHYWSMDALRIGRWRYLGWLNRFIKKNWRRISARFGLIATLLWIWRIFRRKPSRHTMPSGFGLVPTFYWALSGYGVRAARAFWILVGLCAAFAALYMGFGPPKLQDLGQAVVYSLGAVARLNPEPKPTGPGLFQLLVIVEGILGPLQIALLALAVRRKVMR
jgi:uncharacterized protein YjbI with pentapeptide repeats